jgi:hypothetical protein
MTCFEGPMPLPVELKPNRAALEKQGWLRQFTTDQTRLDEMVDFYQSLGYEVRVEPACEELTLPECLHCYEKFCERYKTIFVRRS